jgi:hypothetical protein
LKASTIMGLESTWPLRAPRPPVDDLRAHLSAEESNARIEAVDIEAVRRVARRVFPPADHGGGGTLARLESDDALAARFNFRKKSESNRKIDLSRANHHKYPRRSFDGLFSLCRIETAPKGF